MSMVPYLIATEGPNVGTTYLLGTRTLVGRGSGVDIQVPEGLVSRRHALILKGSDGVFRIGDLSSTNGTYVSGYRVSGCRLAIGETIRVGGSKFLFLQAESVEDILAGLTRDELRSVSVNASRWRQDREITLHLESEVAWWHGFGGADAGNARHGVRVPNTVQLAAPVQQSAS